MIHRWAEQLQPTLALLDEGLSLYRRNFVGFMLIAVSWLVPAVVAAGLVIVAASRLEAAWPILLALAAALALFPLLIYLVGGLSRAAAAAAEGRPVRFREALAIPPRRAAGMGCFTVIYWIIAQVASSFLSILCVCPLYLVGFMTAGLLGRVGGVAGASGVALLSAGIFLFGLSASLMIGGATGSGLFYGLQPWVHEARPFGETLARSLELLGYRFWQNLLVWLLAALLVAAGGLSVIATIGTLLPLPLALLFGDEAPAVRAIAAGAWMLGLVVVVPPLPIWMALLYRRNRAAYEGIDLVAQIQEWAQIQHQESTIRD